MIFFVEVGVQKGGILNSNGEPWLQVVGTICCILDMNMKAYILVVVEGTKYKKISSLEAKMFFLILTLKTKMLKSKHEHVLIRVKLLCLGYNITWKCNDFQLMSLLLWPMFTAPWCKTFTSSQLQLT